MKEQTLQATMLGGFSLSYNGQTVGDSGTQASRMWSVLAYLIVYRYRNIPQSELIDVFWGEDDVANPVGALKTLIYRIRGILDQLGLESKKLILSRGGSYHWECDESLMEVDTERFEQLCQAGVHDGEDDAAVLSNLEQALALYHGDFLSTFSIETWTIPLSAYYNNMYIRAVYAAIAILRKQGAHEKILELCRQATSVAPYDEPLNTEMIISLSELGRREAAIHQCQQVVEMLYQQFAISPSDSFMDMYKEILRDSNIEETTLSDFSERIVKSAPERGAYYCEPAVFEEICRYDMMNKLRTGQAAFLALLTLRNTSGEPLSSSAAERIMKTLSQTVRDSLRSSDCFAIIDSTQLSILLQNTSYENAIMVLQRLENAFKRRCFDRNADLSYNLEPLGAKRVR